MTPGEAWRALSTAQKFLLCAVAQDRTNGTEDLSELARLKLVEGRDLTPFGRRAYEYATGRE